MKSVDFGIQHCGKALKGTLKVVANDLGTGEALHTKIGEFGSN